MNEISVGGIISRSVSIWFRNIIPFTLVSAIVYLPMLIYAALVIGDPTLDGFNRWQIGNAFVPRVFGLIATGAVTYGVFQQLRGSHASMARSMGVGLSRLLPVLVLSFVVGLISVLGTLALIVPGAILTCMLFVAVPAAIIERVGLGAALKRSAELTSGYKWTIFGMLFVIGGVQGVTLFIIQRVLVGAQVDSFDEMKSLIVFETVFLVLVSSFQAVIGAVTYHDLRVAKEGVATDELARVFD